MRVEWQRIEKQVGKAVAGEMLFERDALREHQTSRIDGSRGGLSAKVVLGGGVVAQQPQHTSLDVIEEAHPDFEHRRRNLVAMIEATEHEPALRQPYGLPTWCLGRDRHL